MRKLGPDRPLLLTVSALAVYGLLVLYSAGQTDAPTGAAGAWLRQLVWLCLGVVAAALTFRISFRLLEWGTPAIYVIGLVLVGLTLVVGTGAGTATGTKSWLAIGGIRIGQPAEFAKLSTILFLAWYLGGLKEPPDSLRGLLPACLVAGAPFLLVVGQKDLGSALVFGGILFTMLYWAGVRPFLLLLLASPLISMILASNTMVWGIWMVVLLMALILWRTYVTESVAVYLVNSAMGVVAITLWNRLQPYQQQRLTSFLNPEIDPSASGYQAIQSKVAIGSGGWLGNGLTQGPQKRLGYIPEQHTDFVFPIVGEELGFVGVVVALALFLALLLILLRIARRSTDRFASLVAFGVLGLFLTHVIENIGMTVSLMPITGIPLPFFSYGGSFLLTSSIAVGLALRVAWDSRLSGYAE